MITPLTIEKLSFEVLSYIVLIVVSNPVKVQIPKAKTMDEAFSSNSQPGGILESCSSLWHSIFDVGSVL